MEIILFWSFAVNDSRVASAVWAIFQAALYVLATSAFDPEQPFINPQSGPLGAMNVELTSTEHRPRSDKILAAGPGLRDELNLIYRKLELTICYPMLTARHPARRNGLKNRCETSSGVC